MGSKQSISLLSLSIIAAGAIVACRAVTLGAVNGATDLFGVAETGQVSGQAVSCARVGTAAVEAGAAIPLGTKYLIADASGRAIPGGTKGACLGELKPSPGNTASAAGDFVEVILSLTV